MKYLPVMDRSSMYDHVRLIDAGHPDGIYRVVGTNGETVILLRVSDADGRRVHTGEVVSVPSEKLDAFEPADNPDGTHTATVQASLLSALEITYWSVWAFGRQLAAHPIATALTLGLALAGVFGNQIMPLPDAVSPVLLFGGSLGLAYVGSGRFSI